MDYRRMHMAAVWMGCWLAASLGASATEAQSLHVSFDEGLEADVAVGRAEPWESDGVELVSGRFGQAARVGEGGQLIYDGEKNLLASRGTLALWVRLEQRPGPKDIQRLVFVQAKERGYWHYLVSMEWQDAAFRAKVFDFYHGHGLHDPDGLEALEADRWHHLAIAWDQAHGTRFYLDGELIDSTWDEQAWWMRPTPHAIHLSYPNATYDELVVYEHALNEEQIAALAASNASPKPGSPEPLDAAAQTRLIESAGWVGEEDLPTVRAGPSEADTKRTVIEQARVREILDDRIPMWRVMDGRTNLFWPDWRAAVLGDVDFSGSQLTVAFEPGQRLTHLVLRGLVGGATVYSRRDHDGRVVQSIEPIVSVPEGLHFFAADRLPEGITGLRLPRREGMKLHHIDALAVQETAHDGTEAGDPAADRTPIVGRLADDALPEAVERDLALRHPASERTVLGDVTGHESDPDEAHAIAALQRVHLLAEAHEADRYLTGVALDLTFTAAWNETRWWVRVSDPVNPQRDVLDIPLRVVNEAPGEPTSLALELDFWAIVLESGTPLRVELMPEKPVTLHLGSDSGTALTLLHGEREAVLAEFAHTQGQLAFSYWQLGSEQHGGRGHFDRPHFAMLGSISHNRESNKTLEWVLRHVPDDPLAEPLWRIISDSGATADVEPALAPDDAPEWAVWGRELLGRYRWMAHHWVERQGPDGQIGGGWNDDPTLPGSFLALPLLGDEKTQAMFARIFDGLYETEILEEGIPRGHTDALHASDFTTWQAHMMIFDYGEPRWLLRALEMTRALKRWTDVDERGHRDFLTTYFSEDGPTWRPATRINSAGLISPAMESWGGFGTTRAFLRDPVFYGWYANHPETLDFLRGFADEAYDRLHDREPAWRDPIVFERALLLSFAVLFDEDERFLTDPMGAHTRDSSTFRPMWRRYAQRLPDGDAHDEGFLERAARDGASESDLVTGYLASGDVDHLVRAMRRACERFEGGWQFRGGPAAGATDRVRLPGLTALSQLYLGAPLNASRAANALPPLAVSWTNLDDRVAARVIESSPTRLRVAIYSFDERPRRVGMRLWELEAGRYERRSGLDHEQDDTIDESLERDEGEVDVQRASRMELTLPAEQVKIVELEQLEAMPRPTRLPDLAVSDAQVAYDVATDRLKLVVHNLGAAPAKDVLVRFEDPAGNVLGERRIERLDPPHDLKPRPHTVWLGQPTMHRVDRIIARVDPDRRIEQITRENNTAVWHR